MIPDWQDICKPFLEMLSDDKPHHINKELVPRLADYFNLTPEERTQTLKSGDFRFRNRVWWARYELFDAKLIESPQKGFVKITERGRKVLKEDPAKIDKVYLMQFPEHREANKISPEPPPEESKIPWDEVNPEEVIQEGEEILNNKLKKDLLSKILNMSPTSFERLVLEVITKMGYGGPSDEYKLHMGKSGDEGIDGIIKQDLLGLDKVYLQAKRWVGSVGRQEIQKFVGALHGQGAKKGIFITTSSFTNDAKSYAERELKDMTVVLIDGDTLVDHMISFDIGVQGKYVVRIKKVDDDYFEEF